MTDNPITIDEIDRLLRFLPRFDAANARFVARWIGGPQVDGTNAFPFPIYSPRVREFIELVARSDHGCDPDVARAMLDDQVAIDRASLADIQSLLTYCVRRERFFDGHWELMLRSGRITKVLRRLQVLRDAAE